MDKHLAELYGALYNLVGLHKQLLEIVRAEKEVLVSADTKKILEVTLNKETILNSIHQVERSRLQAMVSIAAELKKPVSELILSKLIMSIQVSHAAIAQKLSNIQNTLVMMIKRIQEQNKENKLLLEQSMLHVNNMKQNILGEIIPNADLYTKHGKKMGSQQGTHLISKEL